MIDRVVAAGKLSSLLNFTGLLAVVVEEFLLSSQLSAAIAHPSSAQSSSISDLHLSTCPAPVRTRGQSLRKDFPL